MAIITVYEIGYANVFIGDAEIDVADPILSPIPSNYTKTSPHPIPNGHYAVMKSGWEYVEGDAPKLPDLDYSAQNKSQAEKLLQQTDWVELPSVSDLTSDPHLLNVQEFLSYRKTIREIAVNPSKNQIVFPDLPLEKWSSSQDNFINPTGSSTVIA